MKGPCLNCPDREIGCHGSCEKYAAFKDLKRQETHARIHENGFRYGSKFSKRKYDSGRYNKWHQ